MKNPPPLPLPTPTPTPPRLRLAAPADILAAVPHLLGFHPDSSLVVIGAGGQPGRVRLSCRYDLPDPPEPAAATRIAEHVRHMLGREHLTTAIVVGYGPGRLVTPLTDVLAPALRQAGLTLREMMRAEHGRYWSYLCTEPGCCPPEGVPFDISCHPVAAAMTVAGVGVYPDRSALARSLDPVTGKAAERMKAATSRACERAAALVAEAGQAQAGQGRAGHARAAAGGALRLVVAAGRQAVREAIAAYRAGSAVTDDQLAWLAVTLTDLRVRDDAWARMEPPHQDAHLRLWTDVVRRADPAQVPAPAALLAFVAWQSGNGALAGIAIDRALAADPGYSLALLLRDIVEAGVPPSEAQLPMTPEEVEQSYETAGQEPSPPPGPAAPGRTASGRARPGAGHPQAGRGGGPGRAPSA
jgi:hypothetical protein